ncbi:CAP domain-containing protein [Lactobacillus terrae]|uniref:CAP domain-containing protein n=1 Tax=Lactobacillus terrae TaxID=2269374 RepID=UPI000C1B7CB0|nr:CAP domain-containing protein [Lactobacillus terrae]
MFIKKSKLAIIVSAGLILASSFPSVALADNVNTENQNTVQTENVTNSNNENVAVTQSSAASSIDIEATKQAILKELNRLRSQNGLPTLQTRTELNTYAQKRTDSLSSAGDLDNHIGWNPSQMAPYNYNTAENISLMGYSLINSTDPTTVAQKITKEFYSENYDPKPDYGHRKSMLNPYVSYVGIGLKIASNGVIYVSQEFGNDAAASKSFSDTNNHNYYLSRSNDYANVSKYDLVDSSKTNSDYTKTANYTYLDLRGGVTVPNNSIPVYDRNGNKLNNVVLAPNTEYSSDMIAIMNNSYFFHISENQFVSSNNVLSWASFLSSQTPITANNFVPIYDNNGKLSGRYVEKGSTWVIDRVTVNMQTNAGKMYRVGTNAWLKASDITIK